MRHADSARRPNLDPSLVYDLFVFSFQTMKLSAIASALQVRLENGSPDTEITGLNGIEQAGPGELTFVSNPKYGAAARTTRASAVIVGEDFPPIPAAVLRAKDPYLTFARALEIFLGAGNSRDSRRIRWNSGLVVRTHRESTVSRQTFRAVFFPAAPLVCGTPNVRTIGDGHEGAIEIQE